MSTPSRLPCPSPNEPFKALFAFDGRVRELFAPYRSTAGMKALDWCGKIGDQPQLRILSAGLFLLGAARSDGQMIRAGARMLLAHELATFIKNRVKDAIDRPRPRSAAHRDEQEPRPGNKSGKEETSFPSGHSAGSMAVACAFAAEYPHHRIAALAASGAAGAARVPTCAHYPSDVAAGWAIGAVADVLIGLVWRAVADRRG